MNKKALYAGLILIPFLSNIRLEPFVKLPGAGVQDSKIFLATAICTLIVIFTLLRDGIKPFKNKFALAFMALVLISPWYIPPFRLIINSFDEGGFWINSVIIDIVLYFMTILAIASMNININKIFDVMIWCGFIMSIYVILQTIGIEQPYVRLPLSFLRFATQINSFGTIGNPTWVGAFLCIIPPIAFFRGKKFKALIMTIATLCTGSIMAIVALCMGMLVYLCSDAGRSMFIAIIPCLLIAMIAGGVIMKTGWQSQGRVLVWREALKDFYGSQKILEEKETFRPEVNAHIKQMNSFKYCFTGMGWGSWDYIFSRRIKTKFRRAHNEYLEIMYNAGLFGIILFTGAIISMFLYGTKQWLPIHNVLLSSMFAMLICALGTTVWQVEPSRFYSVVLAGLLYNKSYGQRIKHA